MNRSYDALKKKKLN